MKRNKSQACPPAWKIFKKVKFEKVFNSQFWQFLRFSQMPIFPVFLIFPISEIKPNRSWFAETDLELKAWRSNGNVKRNEGAAESERESVCVCEREIVRVRDTETEWERVRVCEGGRERLRGRWERVCLRGWIRERLVCKGGGRENVGDERDREKGRLVRKRDRLSEWEELRKT